MSSDNLYQQQPVFLSTACVSFSHLLLHAIRRTAHCQFNRVQVQALPTEQAAPVLTDFFRGVMTPTLTPGKARPLTTVGRTSLSVIIIIIR